MKKMISIIVCLILILSTTTPAFADENSEIQSVEIFFSAGCSDCWPYTQDILIPSIRSVGLDNEYNVRDFTNPAERRLLSNMIDDLGLPRSIADSLYAFIPTPNGMLVILGHVPAELIKSALKSPDLPSKLVIWQPKMHGEPTEYKLWAWKGEVLTFPIETSFEKALAATENSTGILPAGLANLSELLPAVLVTGLIDSVNPCAFAVILLLIAFLFTLRESRIRVLQLGLAYIAMIFIVYFSIGIGLLRVIRLSDDPHFVARLGSWLLIILGGINLLEYVFPEFPIKLHMPAFAGDKAHELIKKATLPATLIAGFLVGLCTFPCSGGIYVSIITLLNARTTLSWGLVYLLVYNLMFILPLIIILLSLGNRVVAKKWAGWERQHSNKIRLWYGLVMIALGFVMLIWII